mgnify:CR=1 FL=1
MTFVFDEELIRGALEANHWHTLWHPENWVRDDDPNPDYNGVNIKEAFRRLLLSKNMIPVDYVIFWSE